MKITKSTLLADIIDSHKKRVRTLEKVIQVFLVVICIKFIVGKFIKNTKKGR